MKWMHAFKKKRSPHVTETTDEDAAQANIKDARMDTGIKKDHKPVDEHFLKMNPLRQEKKKKSNSPTLQEGRRAGLTEVSPAVLFRR